MLLESDISKLLPTREPQLWRTTQQDSLSTLLLQLKETVHLQAKALTTQKLWDSVTDSSEPYTDDIFTRIYPHWAAT